jgi:hypothetical protein
MQRFAQAVHDAQPPLAAFAAAWTKPTRPGRARHRGAGLTRLTDPALVEAIAERISWDGGDFTRWSPDAHPDHNRWSWRGDGHGPAMRAQYRQQARAAVAVVVEALEEDA